MFAVSLTTTDVELLAIIVVLLVLSTFLAMAETALTRMTKSRARALAEAGGFGSRRVADLVDQPAEFLNVVLLVVLVAQLVQATLVGVVAQRLFGGWGIAIATVINVVVVFVIAEAIPKTWAIEHTDRAAKLSAPFIWPLVRFWPLRMLSRGLIGMANIILPGKGLADGPFVSEEELLALADVAVSEDVIEAEERELIEQVIEFGDTICREVMVPRPDMVVADDSDSVTHVLGVALDAGRSRVPVCGENIDDVTGVAYVKDLVRAARAGREGERVSRFARRPFFVPETKRIAELLPEMQQRKSHFAIVIDEYGGTAGIVTLEDIIEELVGEIVDEFDHEEAPFERLPGGAVRARARMSIFDLNDELPELLGFELPEGDWDTVGGLLLHLLGHVPFNGESARGDGFRLVAERVVGRRIETVLIERDGEAVDGAVEGNGR